jgi:glycosyltransferase involved in cell wall biosynthesis
MREPVARAGGAARRVALFTAKMDAGGVQRAIVSLARDFVARGVEVELLLSRARGEMLAELPREVRVRELAARWPLAARALYDVPGDARKLAPSFVATGMPRAVRSLAPLADHLRREAPDALLATPMPCALVALWAAALAGSPVRIVAREANTLSQQIAQRSQLFTRHLPALAHAWYPRAAGIVTVSEGVADDLSRSAAIPRERIVTIHNPLDVARIRALAAEQPTLPWLRDAAGPPVIAAAGRLVHAKDFATLIRAFARVRARRAARLVILGRGPERLRLALLARRLGVARDVQLAGYVANPFAVMARARVFALSSRYEGLANVLREALACGANVVATDCPSGSAEVLRNGALGRLVPVGDAGALADALLAALDETLSPEAVRARIDSVSGGDAASRYLELLLPLERAPSPVRNA